MQIKNASALLFLLVIFAARPAFSEKKDLNGKLYQAVQFSDEQQVRDLLKQGADANHLETNRSMLGWASQNEAGLGVVKALISAKAKLNIVDGVNQTPLMRASETGQFAIVKELIQAGAEVNKKTKHGETALILAVKDRHVEIVKTLLEAKADPNVKTDDDQFAALYAAQDGMPESLEILKILGAAKANLNASNIAYTPLTYAISQDNAELVDVLLSAGADPNSKTQSGHAPLIEALSSPAIFDRLIQAKANPNILNGSGETALTVAIQDGSLEKVQALIKAGADVNFKNKDGSTPLMIAMYSYNNEVTELLKKSGAQ
jgi:ankyrin repeat protein